MGRVGFACCNIGAFVISLHLSSFGKPYAIPHIMWHTPSREAALAQRVRTSLSCDIRGLATYPSTLFSIIADLQDLQSVVNAPDKTRDYCHLV